MNSKNLKLGVSIIIPCARPNEYLVRLLDSIYSQTNVLNGFIEIILVFNGDRDFLVEMIANQLNRLQTRQSVRLLYNSLGNASVARNMGIEASSREFLCFCDDDDWIGDAYISELYKMADSSSIAFAPIVDVSVEGQKDYREDINEFLLAKSPNALSLYSKAITINACKLIPAVNAKQILFDESLKSGEDVVYFCEYINRFRPGFTHVDSLDSRYYRLKTANSTSRQSMSYDFNVEQRLDVIKRLVDISSFDIIGFFQSKVNAQLSFLNKYYDKNPSSLNRIKESFYHRDLSKLTLIKDSKFYINLS